jgi:phage shock protein C
MSARLYRSRTAVIVAGVCGGLGQYLRIDPTLIRLFFVLLSLGNGVGLLAYVILWFVLPVEGEESTTVEDSLRLSASEMAERAQNMGQELRRSIASPNPQAGIIIGAALVVAGLVFLLRNLNIYWLRWLDFGTLWPVALIAAGVVLLWRRGQGSDHGQT